MTAGGRAARYVAIITDGNGRWAAERGLPPIEGHSAGENRRSRQTGRKSSAFFIRPVAKDQVASIAKLVRVSGEDPGGDNGRRDAQRAIKPSSSRLAVQMRAAQDCASFGSKQHPSELVSDWIKLDSRTKRL